jgi:hypothetical protein
VQRGGPSRAMSWGAFPCIVSEVLPVMVGDSLRERAPSEGLPEAPALW